MVNLTDGLFTASGQQLTPLDNWTAVLNILGGISQAYRDAFVANYDLVIEPYTNPVTGETYDVIMSVNFAFWNQVYIQRNVIQIPCTGGCTLKPPWGGV